GGTWLGTDKQGRFAALTNIRNGRAARPEARSRGELVANYLRGDLDARDYMQALHETAADYNGFNLLVGDSTSAYWFSNGADEAERALEPGIYGLSNGALDAPWPKVLRAKAQFASLLCQAAPDDAYFEMLADTTQASDSRLPDTGVSLEWERLLSPICIESPAYGTRASTLLRVHASGDSQLVEKSFARGASKKQPASLHRLDLRLSYLRRCSQPTALGNFQKDI
ncbi:MAG: NRDE family protein, partial [Betaproteobacteria bacterium]|nr:NRDE family protein [Betaproteobacteria bacterium]